MSESDRYWLDIANHIQYAKEIGSNFVGRPGPKWTAFALAEEVEKLRSVLKEIVYLDDNNYLHRDPLDTDKVFNKARKIINK